MKILTFFRFFALLSALMIGTETARAATFPINNAVITGTSSISDVLTNSASETVFNVTTYSSGSFLRLNSGSTLSLGGTVTGSAGVIPFSLLSSPVFLGITGSASPAANSASLSMASGTTISTSGSGTLSISAPAGSNGFNVFTGTISLYRAGETGSYGITIGNSTASGGTSGEVEITAGGTDKSIRLVPSGSAGVNVNGGLLILLGNNPSINDKNGYGRIQMDANSTTTTNGFAIWTYSSSSVRALQISNLDGSITLSGALKVTNATASTGTTSGAAIITGGLGVGGGVVSTTMSTGTFTASNGGTLTGTFAGNHTYSGTVTQGTTGTAITAFKIFSVSASSGTATITDSALTSTSVAFFTIATAGGTIGQNPRPTYNTGSLSFAVTATDTSTYSVGVYIK